MRLFLFISGVALLGCAGVEDEDEEGGGIFGGGSDDDDVDDVDDGSQDDDGDGLTNDEEADLGTDPQEADSDGDGSDDGAEVEEHTDPLDEADKPYEGGWAKGDCRDDLKAEGWDVGDVSRNWSLPDQYGEEVYLHDFCDKSVLVIFSAFW